MGVPQPIELQPQSGNFKYFHLKEEIIDEGHADQQLIKEVPQLSVWGWLPTANNFINTKLKRGLTKSQQKSDIMTSSSSSTASSNSSSGYHTPEMDHETSSNSGSSISSDEESPATSDKDFKLDFHYQANAPELDITIQSKYKKANDNTIYPYSPIYSDIVFSILVGVVCIFSIIYSFLVGPLPIIFAFFVSILVLVSYIFVCMAPHNRWYIYSITALAVGLGLCIPSFFNATGQVVLAGDLPTWDKQLLRGDSMLLGWIFPQGQMGLFIDRSNIVGPDSIVGEFSTELFQLAYISYYIWGYFMEVYILFRLWKASLSKDLEEKKTIAIWDQRLKMFICSWISTYFVVFSINLMFPAVSPRVYLNGEYKNQLRGFGFAGMVRDMIEDAAKGSFGSFPSGHIATSWAVAFASYKIVPIYGLVSAVAAFLITIATMYLRYHYFVDFLAAIPVTIVCLAFGGFYGVSDVKNAIRKPYIYLKSKFGKDKRDDNMF